MIYEEKNSTPVPLAPAKWTFFDGNYQEYEADKKKRLGEEGAKPKRIRYKPISR